MAAPFLFENGWRQGSILRVSLSAQTLDLIGGTLKPCEQAFDAWLLATQDCDLNNTKVTNTTRLCELRPLFPAQQADRIDGIRTRVARVTDDLVLRSDGPRLCITPRALDHLAPFRDNALSDERRREIKTWLGLRYDRPAVPIRFESLSYALKDHLYRDVPIALKGRIRDILVYYRSESEVDIFCVVRDAKDRDEVTDWIDSLSMEFANNVTILTRTVEASDKTPLHIIETYYGLDSAELSSSSEVWPEW